MTTPTDTWLPKIQALLAKAQSTEFPDEAEALMAKAQDLMTRHAIDEAMLQANAHHSTDFIDTEIIVVSNPYAIPKTMLFSNIAEANNCRVLMGKDGKSRVAMITGYGSDRRASLMMFASLEIYLTRELASTLTPWGESAKSFRHSFVVAFANRIGARLREAARQAIQDYEEETGELVALILVNKEEKVETRMKELYPRMRTQTVSTRSAAGNRAGSEAANRANLSAGVGSGSRKALSQD